jgi:hypothetical protein
MADFLTRFKSQTRPLDRLAIVLIAGLSLVVGVLVLWGDRTAPKVRDFSWTQPVGAEDTAFTLTFNRPMNWESVSQKLQISPELPGKTSWSGRRLAYTLTQPVPYGQTFQLKLASATGAKGGTVEPFTANFKSRDLSFAYLGVNGDEAGRVILYNQTQDKKTVLTPENLSVLRFKAYPKGDRLLFSATERTPSASGMMSAKLYQVTTGLAPGHPAGKVDLILDNQDYQILKFDLATTGDRIVVERTAKNNMMDANLWQIRGNGKPEPLKTSGGGDFLIAPDGQTLVLAQGQGLALIALDDQASDKPLDFLPKFGMVLNFAPDGSAASMLKFNTDFTRSLFLVTNQGTQKELLRTKGSILSSQFSPQRDAMYCLLNKLISENPYQEQPYIAKIDLKTAKVQELLTLPIQQNVKFSLAPDGSKLLFDQSSSAATANGQQPTGNQPMKNILSLALSPAGSTTPLPAPKVQAVGSDPQWLP